MFYEASHFIVPTLYLCYTMFFALLLPLARRLHPCVEWSLLAAAAFFVYGETSRSSNNKTLKARLLVVLHLMLIDSLLTSVWIAHCVHHEGMRDLVPTTRLRKAHTLLLFLLALIYKQVPRWRTLQTYVSAVLYVVVPPLPITTIETPWWTIVRVLLITLTAILASRDEAVSEMGIGVQCLWLVGMTRLNMLCALSTVQLALLVPVTRSKTKYAIDSDSNSHGHGHGHGDSAIDSDGNGNGNDHGHGDSDGDSALL
jgi:hypothetical protein